MEGRYTLVNRTFEALFDITRERATGHTDDELFPPDVAASMRANDRRVIREHVPLEVEEVIDQADGPHTYLSAKFPLLDSTRTAVRRLRDRHRHHPAQARRGDAARVRAPLPPDRRHRARRVRRDGRERAHHRVEPAGRGDVRLDRARGARTQPRRDDHPARATGRRTTAALQRFIQTGKGALLGRRVELEALHRDGHEFPVEFTISAVKVGGTYAFNAFLHDITERKQAEETLRRLADVVQSSHDAIIATGPDGEITAWNAGRDRALRVRARGADRPHPRRPDAGRARTGRRAPAVAGARGPAARGPRDRAPAQGRQPRARSRSPSPRCATRAARSSAPR